MQTGAAGCCTQSRVHSQFSGVVIVGLVPHIIVRVMKLLSDQMGTILGVRDRKSKVCLLCA